MAYCNRGFAYRQKNDYDKAVENYTEAIRLNPDFFAAYINRCSAYSLKGDRRKAAADLEKAIKLNPEYGRHLKNQ